ncbi:hypothetical protein EZ456_16980 [Pedobacter psychrodurus]|uniref:Uncharacterized protein n=1 Tax=Pedobacter psychrodurus TaxID=2530456 RepID=A0A4R0PUK7_9SPHI|nr:hypothetical protein [Pedobacter psychrodurus]TCD24778.1 hypothetical protein EZ456_16980 [Pedobacter psychrodurus]
MVNKSDWNEHPDFLPIGPALNQHRDKVESRTAVTEKPLHLLFKLMYLVSIFSRLKITLKNISLRKDEAYT